MIDLEEMIEVSMAGRCVVVSLLTTLVAACHFFPPFTLIFSVQYCDRQGPPAASEDDKSGRRKIGPSCTWFMADNGFFKVFKWCSVVFSVQGAYFLVKENNSFKVFVRVLKCTSVFVAFVPHCCD